MRTLRAYLELLRPANVITALADVLAGYAIAGRANHATLPWLLTSTACLYGGGVVLNDFFDRALDRIERPERPIPSGRVSPHRAAVFGAVLMAAGVAAAMRATPAAGGVAAAIVALVLSYDAWAKHIPFVGPFNMGACRGLNLLLGVAAVPAALETRWPLAFLPIIYIFAVTTVSRGEVHGGSRQIGRVAFACMVAVLGALAAISLRAGSPLQWVGLALTTLLGTRVLPAFWKTARDGSPAISRRAVRTGVLSLVLVDATLGSVYAGPFYALLILAVAALAWACARAFAVT
jgi:4-hydroxybenzoate polyprenyltransferase